MYFLRIPWVRLNDIKDRETASRYRWSSHGQIVFIIFSTVTPSQLFVSKAGNNNVPNYFYNMIEIA